VDDLAVVDELTEAAVRGCLEQRFQADKIYTYVGDILIAVNPYKQLGLYLPHVQAKYLRCNRADHPPHIYYVAYSAYEAMLRSRANQVFVISGESGAGKTESSKYLVSHVIELCKAGNKELESRITQLNPLVEAFGNAKTVMNNNSSRFGKYLELKFDLTGAVKGAQLSEYLLEKSRVTAQAPGEQNYHVFYILLAGLKSGMREQLGLGGPSAHAYLRSPGAPADSDVMNAKNAEALPQLLSTFTDMGFDAVDLATVQMVLSAMLLLGDVQFGADKDDCATVGDSGTLVDKVASLLKVERSKFEEALLASSSQAAKETITRRYTRISAGENRDALSRSLYSRLFGWLISACNDNLIERDALDASAYSLGILDIFGFENFNVNSLEQLCINITNEKLQFYFNNFIFAMEQAEYAAEGIPIESIEFEDNTPTLDLLLGKPKGILPLLDEESRFPKATDLTYTQKVALLSAHGSGSMVPPPSDRDPFFSVRHYAGLVKYTTTGFLNKNRDTISQDVVNVMRFSEDDFIASLWAAPKTTTGTFKVRKGSREVGKTKKNPITVCSQFSNSLTELMTKVEQAKPHFVRCIKPNAEKQTGKWSGDLVERQLRYSGVLETVKIRKLGFSVREDLADFVGKYSVIAYSQVNKPEPTRETADRIMKVAGVEGYQHGKKKVFMKYFHPEQLTAALRRYREAHLFVQRACRGLICRVRYRHMVESKRSQTAAIEAVFAGMEASNDAVRAGMLRLGQVDHAAAEKRKWLKTLKKRAEKAEKERLKQEAEAKAKAEKEAAKAAAKEAAKYNTKKRGKVVDGNHVFVRNEQLTKRVGKLDAHWEKKVDPKTGRVYFKNHQTRQTTWIDPRTKQTRKADAKDCAMDELPYGWDEAEIDGEVYYIDHINQKTHWVHPRLLLDDLRQDFIGKEEGVQARADVIRAVIKQYRDKRGRLEDLKAEAGDEELVSLEQRIEAMDAVIQRELDNLKVITSENNALKNEIKALNTAFGQAAFVGQGGNAADFAAGDVKDLYAAEKGTPSLPHKLDTLTRDQLRALNK